MTIEQIIATQQAKPKTHKAVTLYDDGRAKEHFAASEAQAENWAIGERRKIGRTLIDRATGRSVCVVAVYVAGI